jgi:hypothetical protein
MHTNKQRFIDQMVNRDILEKVHEKMNDEMVVAEANIAAVETDSAAAERDGSFTGPGTTPSVDPHTGDIPRHWCRIAQDQSNKHYLPHFVNEPQNATDPAFKVCTGVQTQSDNIL